MKWRVYIKDDGDYLIAGPKAPPTLIETWKAKDDITEMESDTGDSFRDVLEFAEQHGAHRSKIRVCHPPGWPDLRSPPN